jgi:hypothetical protein
MIELNQFYTEAENQWLLPIRMEKSILNGELLYRCIRIRYYHGSAKKDRFSIEGPLIHPHVLERGCGNINDLKMPRQKRVIEAVFSLDIRKYII